MIIDLETLLPGTQTITSEEEVPFEDVDGSENRIACNIELTVSKSNEEIYVHAAVSGVFKTLCHSCLEPAECRVEPTFDIVVKKTGSSSRTHGSGEDEDMIYISSEDRELSLDQQIYENLIASMPIRILCRDDCKGLCAGCGANLNVEACRCAKPVETRWNELRSPGGTEPK